MTAFLLTVFICASEVKHPVYPPDYTHEQTDALKKAVAPAMALSVQELYDLVPEQSGIFFCGCPNCDGGAQEHALQWHLGMGDTVQCRYCGMQFPNEHFTSNRSTTLATPSGGIHEYRWYENEEGRQYYFEARAWYEQWQWTRDMALKLANLYALTGDFEYGSRAAAIVGRYAQVFPDYAIRFDYPFRPVRFWPADQKWPYEPGFEPFRGAKFSWWGYGDIPSRLALAYDLLASGDVFERMSDLLGTDIRTRIERDLIRLGYEFVVANPDDYTNMSPGMYCDMIIAGRVLGAPEMVREALERAHTLVETQFFADGWWRECAPSYHWQTLGTLEAIVRALRGYSDPALGPEPPAGEALLAEFIPMLARARQAGEEALLPDGRIMPLNDTWASDRRAPLSESVSRLWPHMGHAILGAGTGETQFQVHINWNASYGHTHLDTGAILLFAHGKEMLSDIGYTHTRYRNWVINSASHNMVVVDQRSQPLKYNQPAMGGNLLFFDDADPHVQLVDLDASPAYPECSIYRRRLLHVHLREGFDYVVDCFDVAGGATHDFFLHGSADEPGTLQTAIELHEPVASLVPDWGGTEPYTGEDCTDTSGERHHPYAFLRNIRAGACEGPLRLTWRYGDTGLTTCLFPEPLSTACQFQSPAIRPAGEVDQHLDDHLMEGFLIRHSGGTSRFLAVHIPWESTEWVTEVTQQAHELTITHETGRETIRLDENRITVTSSEGWEYATGTPAAGKIEAIHTENGEAVIVCDCDVPPAGILRLEAADGRTLCLRAARMDGNRVVLAEDPGLTLDAASQGAVMRFHPRATLPGPLTWTVWPR
ncbi:MAG TPA: heparinase II/III family protein [Candidatus Hydrogenedentes bacterium]|jgi:hypothetical protein|nr:heparinase II/III family protein [Candidatus Hydrogenedentota bacterium]